MANSPGDHVRWFAGQMKWPICRNNILVEGNDSRYFALASELYMKETGVNLLADLAIFPTGDGDDGGTYGIQRHFPTLRTLIDTDTDLNGKKLFMAIALVDYDAAGKHACRSLAAKYTRFKENRDVFLLRRTLPRVTCDSTQLGIAIEKANDAWKALDCEIEDLVRADLLHEFVRSSGSALRRPPVFLNGAHHCEFSDGAKPEFLRFVQKSASLQDLDLVVEVLKSLRFYLRLTPM